jgi:hypothetical protein
MRCQKWRCLNGGGVGSACPVVHCKQRLQGRYVVHIGCPGLQCEVGAPHHCCSDTSSLPVCCACSGGAPCRQGLCPAWILAVLLVTLRHAARWNVRGLRVGGVRLVRGCLAVCCPAGCVGASPACKACSQSVTRVAQLNDSMVQNQPWLQQRALVV